MNDKKYGQNQGRGSERGESERGNRGEQGSQYPKQGREQGRESNNGRGGRDFEREQGRRKDVKYNGQQEIERKSRTIIEEEEDTECY